MRGLTRALAGSTIHGSQQNPLACRIGARSAAAAAMRSAFGTTRTSHVGSYRWRIAERRTEFDVPHIRGHAAA